MLLMPVCCYCYDAGVHYYLYILLQVGTPFLPRCSVVDYLGLFIESDVNYSD